MKITIFGLTISSSWGNGHATPYRAIVKALYRQGHDVTFYEKDVPYYAKHRDFKDCDYSNLVLYSDWGSVRSAALECARNSDAVIGASFCPEGARILGEILDLQGPIKVFYDLDTPVTLSTPANAASPTASTRSRSPGPRSSFAINAAVFSSRVESSGCA